MATSWDVPLATTANFTAAPSGLPVKGSMRWEVTGSGDKAVTRRSEHWHKSAVAGVRQQLEMHLLDVVMDLYDRHIDVILRKSDT